MQERNKSVKGFGTGVPRVLDSAYWNIKDLLTEGVTREGLQELFEKDARETFRFSPEHRFAIPYLLKHKRYPRMVWLVRGAGAG
jgi:hypothetical protein